jgi:hypothetical protein
LVDLNRLADVCSLLAAPTLSLSLSLSLSLAFDRPGTIEWE